MKKLFFIPTILFLLMIANGVYAEDFQLIYSDGEVSLKKGSGWVQIYSGDIVPEASVVRLGPGGVAEFAGEGSTVIFSKPGTYQIESAAEQSRTVQSSAFSSVFSRLSKMGEGTGRGQSQAMGVRGAESDDEFGFTWVEEDTMSFEEAVDAFDEEDFSLAIDILKNEVDPLALDDESSYWYYLAASYMGQGKKGPALQVVKEHSAGRMSAFYSQYLLLKGRLLLESFDFAGAAQQFEEYIGSTDNPGKLQIAYYLHGYSLQQQGYTTSARNALQKAVEINSDPEVSRLAQELMDS